MIENTDNKSENADLRQKAEEKIQEQAKLLDLIFKHSLDCIVLLDKDYNFINVSDSYAKLCNRTVEEFKGHNHFEFYPSPLKDEFDDAIAKRINYSKNSRPFVFPDRPELGTTYWDLSMVPIRGADDSIDLILFTLKDVTERKLAEEELRQSNQKLETIISASPDGIGVISLDGKIKFLSDKGLELFGYSLEDRDKIIGTSALEFIDHSDRDKVIDDILKLIGGERENNLTRYKAIKKDKSRFFIEINSDVLYDPYGKPEGILYIERDITERKQMEKVLRESEEKYRSLVQYSSDPIFSYNSDGTYRYSNEAFAKPFGKTPDEIIGKTPHSLFSPDEAEKRLDIVRKVFSTGEKGEIEVNIITMIGERKHFLTMIDPIKDSLGNVLWVSCVSKDITERKRSEDFVKQIRQNYELFFDTIDEFLFVLDEQGNIIHFNSTVIDRLGYTPEELIGSSVLMVHPPERGDEAGRIVGEMLSGTAEFCPVPLITKTGVYIPVETRVTAGLWDGKPAIFGVTKDISQISLSEEKFSKVFYINPSASGLTDVVTGKYVEVNESFCSLLGYMKDEVIGKSAVELDILSSEVKSYILRHLEDGKIKDFETELRAKDGTIKNVLLSADNIYIQEKKFRYTVVHDITERKQAEEKIRHTNEELALQNEEIIKQTEELIIAHNALGDREKELRGNYAILHSVFESPQNIIIFALDTNYCYTAFTNFHKQTMKNIWGVIIERGMNMLEVIRDPDDRAKAKNNFDRGLKGEYLRFEEEYGDSKLHRDYYDNIYNPIIDSNGDILGLAVFVIDITERKRMEDQIIRTNIDLHRANSEKDKFFSIIAHDLKSPFQGLLGLSEILATGSDGLSSAEIAQFSSSLHFSLVNVYQLLDNLLEWAQFQKGSFAFTPSELCICDIFLESESSIKQKATQKGITIINEIPKKYKVFADGKMINSVLRNLLSNAVKFTKKGGKVVGKAREIESGMIEISVTDTGVGISADVIGKLFTLGEDVGTNGTDNEPSTGLGLLLCKEFVEKNGGNIWVESEKNIGSTFYFTLPKAIVNG